MNEIQVNDRRASVLLTCPVVVTFGHCNNPVSCLWVVFMLAKTPAGVALLFAKGTLTFHLIRNTYFWTIYVSLGCSFLPCILQLLQTALFHSNLQGLCWSNTSLWTQTQIMVVSLTENIHKIKHLNNLVTNILSRLYKWYLLLMTQKTFLI